MATCLTYNCEDLTDHEIVTENCQGSRLAGFPNAIFFDCGNTPADPTDPAEIQALITANVAWEVFNIKAGLGDPSAITAGAKTSCGTEQVINYDRTLTIEDYTVSENNRVFWSTLTGGRVLGGMLLQECDTEGYDSKSTFIDAEISFQGARSVANNNGENQFFNITASWRSRTDPEIVSTPAGIFA